LDKATRIEANRAKALTPVGKGICKSSNTDPETLSVLQAALLQEKRQPHKKEAASFSFAFM
jgi:hypothetical protein